MWDFDKFKNNAFLIDESGKEYYYSELTVKSNEINECVSDRCLVFSLCTNSVGSIVGYASFLNKGIVPVMLNAGLDFSLLDSLIQVYLPSYLWVPDSLKGLFPSYMVCLETLGYCLLRTNFQKVYPLNDDLALLLTTSGSTGSPKFVRQSYNNISANTNSIIRYLELDSSERPITTLPMNYTYGLSVINTHLAVGATILATEKGLMQKEFWNFFREGEATSFGGVPYTYEMLDRLRFTRMDLPYLRTMTQAGGKITPELHKKFAEYADNTGKKFVVMYGQCEATARMGYLPADKAVEKCGSMGIAIPGGRFRLVDEKGDEIRNAHVMGELVYEGENVTMGYAECGDDLIKGDERHGVLRTGDMAEFDDEGYYYIVGRKKRFLKIYGNRVNLDEVDRMIKGHFPEIEVASGGVDDHMFIFVNDVGRMQDIRDFISKKTGLHPAAFNMMHLNEIPKNDSGKVVYRDLEKYYKDIL